MSKKDVKKAAVVKVEKDSKAAVVKVEKDSKAAVVKVEKDSKAMPSVSKKSVSSPQPSVTNETTNKEEEHIYEKITPMNFLNRNSWSDGSGAPIGTRWWKQKGKKQRVTAVSKLLLFFCIVVTLVIVLIIVGGYILVKKVESESQLHEKLTSKTALCRKAYPEINPECLTEDHTLHSKCDAGRICNHLQYEFRADKVLMFTKITKTIFNLELNNTENADCEDGHEHPKWCVNKKCQSAGVSPEKWYKSKSFRVKSDVRDVKDLPCLKVKSGSEVAFKNFVSWYVGDCGKSSCEKHCNNSGCKNHMAKYAVRAALYHCDLSMDPIKGTRGTPCPSSVLQIFTCGECEKYNEPAVNAVRGLIFRWHYARECQTGFPDGMPCKYGSKPEKDGICVMGFCQNFTKSG